MGNVITIGVDLAKSVFQVHGVDAERVIVVRRQLRRRQVLPFFEKLPPCLVGWRPVPRRTTRHVRSSSSGIACA
jgi:transposase